MCKILLPSVAKLSTEAKSYYEGFQNFGITLLYIILVTFLVKGELEEGLSFSYLTNKYVNEFEYINDLKMIVPFILLVLIMAQIRIELFKRTVDHLNEMNLENYCNNLEIRDECLHFTLVHK